MTSKTGINGRFHQALFIIIGRLRGGQTGFCKQVQTVIPADQDFRALRQHRLPKQIGPLALFAGNVGSPIPTRESNEFLVAIMAVVVVTKAQLKEDALHMDFRLRDSAGRVLADDLQVHLLQVSKLEATAQNVSGLGLIEQWAYFMLNADSLSIDDILQMFHDQEFAEAAEVLEMISKTPEERMLYNARLKFQMDEAARLEQAQLDAEQARLDIEQALRDGQTIGEVSGRREGLERGELLGRIRTLQEVLGVDHPSAQELADFDNTQLSELDGQLRSRFRNQKA